LHSCMETFTLTALRKDTFEAADSIDAALFTGDEFLSSPEARRELREQCRRWMRKLDEHESNDIDPYPEGFS
jgi:hypothetical protein